MRVGGADTRAGSGEDKRAVEMRIVSDADGRICAWWIGTMKECCGYWFSLDGKFWGRRFLYLTRTMSLCLSRGRKLVKFRISA
jgi:hypothetical protein